MIPIQWTANITNSSKETKESFEDLLRNSTKILDRLVQIVEERERSLDKIDYSLSSYENPNWACKQAHINGRKAELQALKQLITIT